MTSQFCGQCLQKVLHNVILLVVLIEHYMVHTVIGTKCDAESTTLIQLVWCLNTCSKVDRNIVLINL